MNTQRDELTTTHQRLQKELDQLQYTSDKLTKELAELQNRLTEQKSGCMELQSSLKIEREENLRLQAILDDVTAGLESLQAGDHVKQLKQLKHDYTLLEIELNPLETKIQVCDYLYLVYILLL